MSSSNADDLLESVVQITEQRDRDSLEISLVSTLRDLIAAKRITLYKYRETRTGRELYAAVSDTADGTTTDTSEYDQTPPCLPADSQALFAACLEKNEMVMEKSGPDCPYNCCRYLYPIAGSHGVVGFLEIFADRYSEADSKLADGFLRIYCNYLSILDESEHDTLTGLLNRKTFDRNITRILTAKPHGEDDHRDSPTLCRRHSQEGLDHWLAVADIDFFKRINDRFGHLYGDEVLLLLAHVMKKVFRLSDKLFRFGGEEFVILLEPAAFQDALATFERFRKAVEDYDFPQVGRVTVSLGFTRIRSQDVPATIIGQADEALYYAKRHNRNRVCSYEVLVAQGHLKPREQTGDIELF